jgi:hypothetical protein
MLKSGAIIVTLARPNVHDIIRKFLNTSPQINVKYPGLLIILGLNTWIVAKKVKTKYIFLVLHPGITRICWINSFNRPL